MNNTQAIETPSSHGGSHRKKLLLVAAIFLAPPILAWIAFHYFSGDMSSSTSNTGQLVTPARPIVAFAATDADGKAYDEDMLRGRWSYVMYARECGEACRRQLYLTRQIRASVNKDIGRVQRVLVLGGTVTPALRQLQREEHPDLLVVRVDGENQRRLAALLELDGHRLDGQSLYLFDPLGNYMMRYDLGMAPAGMLKDLRKLLKLSRIG